MTLTSHLKSESWCKTDSDEAELTTRKNTNVNASKIDLTGSRFLKV